MSRRIKRIHVSERIEFSAALPTGHSKSSAFSCAGAKASVPRASILRIAKQPLSTICYASQPMPFSSMRQPSFALGGASRTPILLRFAPAQLSTLPGLRNEIPKLQAREQSSRANWAQQSLFLQTGSLGRSRPCRSCDAVRARWSSGPLVICLPANLYISSLVPPPGAPHCLSAHLFWSLQASSERDCRAELL